MALRTETEYTARMTLSTLPDMENINSFTREDFFLIQSFTRKSVIRTKMKTATNWNNANNTMSTTITTLIPLWYLNVNFF